ncbi:MAG: T9SS type A sorting domain-containing protein [Chitinophagaceae bacterium]|nr:T9SS type A sorting domain-containing protein [Chitinophagaceae bacterium]
MKKIYLAFAFAFVSLGLTAQDVMIGDPEAPMELGQSQYRSPWTTSYNYSYVQTIYLQEEINTSGYITKISYIFQGTVLDSSNVLAIYMGTIPDTKDEFISGDYNDWLKTADMVKVYDDTLTPPSTLPGIVTINLTTPFHYLNSGNLVIAVYEKGDGNDYDENDTYTFRSTTGILNRVMYYITDGPDAGDNPLPDLDNLPEADNYKPSYANVILHFETAIPINLASFSATRKDASSNLLKWSTGNEQHNKGFEVQRSADGVNFSNIGFVASKADGGNSNTTLDYSYVDTRAGSGAAYYRLNQIDMDGRGTLSKIVSVKGGELSFSLAPVYPNPVKSSLNLLLTSHANNNVLIEITNIEGKIVHKSDRNLNSGENRININLSTIPAGVYTVRATIKERNESVTTRFVKN